MDSECHLIVCDTFGEHEPVAVFISNTSFPSLAVGDRFDDYGWSRLRGVGVIVSESKPVRYTIHSIKTIVCVKNEKNRIQTGMNLEPYHGVRSPAFGGTEPTMSWREAVSDKFK